MANNAQLTWAPTSAPPASSRYDDVWFNDAELGWAVNSNGQILKTVDGGANWVQKFQTPIVNNRAVYLRCLGFVDDQIGWAGTITPDQRLYHTVDAGESWQTVDNLPDGAPAKICGFYAVDENVIYGSGTNDPSDAAAMIKSVDGGQTWTALDMSAHASSLIDVYFASPDAGWVVGGFTDDPNPTYDNVKPVILRTEDGGATWENRIADLHDGFAAGTWGWKIQFLNDNLGYVSLENFTEAIILKTVDGGQSWEKLPIDGNANLEGVGFLNDTDGWVGGWGDEDFESGTSSATTDGGQSWQNADQIGRFINRFRFFGDPVVLGYAAGRTIYKYSDQPPVMTAAAVEPATKFLQSVTPENFEGTVPIEYAVPKNAKRAAIHIWNRFGKDVRVLIDEQNPQPGEKSVIWDRRDDSGELLRPGVYIYRLTVDGEAESRVISLK